VENRKLWILGIILLVLGYWEPMTMIFPLWILVYLLRGPLIDIADRIQPYTAFLAFGILFGLLIEIFAILENLDKPLDERALFNPHPWIDLVLALYYYPLLILTWMLLLKKINYSKKEVFIITGLYGIVVEQMGVIVAIVISNPFGFIIGLFVVCVHGVFPMLALMLTEHRMPKERKETNIKWWAFGLFCMFLQWAIGGLTLFRWITLALDPANANW
jgi:hypothetical protein